MRKITYNKFLSFDPCWLEKPGGCKRLKAIYDNYPNGMNALDILKRDDVSTEHRLWSVLREDFIDALILHEFACRCAEKALSLVAKPDPRSLNGIAIKRKWLKGEATEEELSAAWSAAWSAASAAYAVWSAAYAARDAAWSAVWSAAYAARDAASEAARDAASAARDAASEAARDAAWSAARDAARDAQVAELIGLLEGAG